jgi:hypothetical protein
MYRLTADKAAAVSTEFFWLPVDKLPPPGGAKVLLINERYGVATIGVFNPEYGFTHWAPLPRFVKEEGD